MTGLKKNRASPVFYFWRAVSSVMRCLTIVILFLHWAEGKTIASNGLGYTKDGAIQAALRSAVEQCVGLSLASETFVKNNTTISDKILSHVSGYVSTYSVVSETMEYGLIKVSISADVSLQRLENDLAAQKLLYEIQNKPRIMVLIDEKNEDKEMTEKTATHTFENKLVSRGFTVIEPEQYDKIAKTENVGDQAALAFTEGADLIVRGNVQVSRPSPKIIYGTQFYTVPVQINARIVRSDNAQILVSRIKSVKKNSREAESAAQFGLAVGGESLAEELIADLINYWSSEAYNENRIELLVCGCTQREQDVVEEFIRHCPCTRGIHLGYIEGMNALFDVDVRGTVQELRAALIKGNAPKVSIASLTSHRIVLKKEGAGVSPLTMVPKNSVDILGLRIQDIFPSRIGYYCANPSAHVKIKNGDQPLVDVKISVIVPDFMTMPSEKRIDQLASSEEKDLPITLIFDNKKILANHENRTVYGQAALSFGNDNAAKDRKLTAPVKVLESNAIDWNELETIGSFVTFRAPIINALATRAVLAAGKADAMNKDLIRAMALFELMQTIGISYIKDPTALPGAMILDRIQYPQETLERRGGDCDDCTVLYASLLSAIGIPAAVISYSDHVLAMFDTRIYRKNREELSADSIMTICHNGTLWIPIETTMLSKGFTDAWRAAAREFHDQIANGSPVSITDLTKAWETYPPAPVPDYDKKFDLKGLPPLISHEKQCLEQAARASVDEAINKIERETVRGNRPDRASLLNTLGVLKARQGNYTEASVEFGKALAVNKQPGFENNAACALLLAGEGTKAMNAFDKLYKQSRSVGIALNRALCMFVESQSESDLSASITALKEAASMLPSPEKIAEYLGIDINEGSDATKGDEFDNQKKQKEINLRQLKELIRKRVLAPAQRKKSDVTGTTSETSSGTKVTGTTTETSSGSLADENKQLALPFGGIRGADPEQVSKVKDLLYWFE